MVKLPQDCNQGKGPGMFVSCPTASFPPTKQLPAKRLLFSVAGMSTGCFSVMATEGWFCRVAILALARCGSSLRRRTRALSPFSVAMESKVFVLNMLRANYTWRATVVPIVRCGWLRNITDPTPSLATAELRGDFSVTAVAGCPSKTSFLAQMSCGNLLSEVL